VLLRAAVALLGAAVLQGTPWGSGISRLLGFWTMSGGTMSKKWKAGGARKTTTRDGPGWQRPKIIEAHKKEAERERVLWCTVGN